MDPTEIAAYLGAAAWLPQIGRWVYRGLVKPVVTVIPDKYAEVGFTSFGPIFNLRMAFSAGRKDVLLDGVELVLVHSDGDSHTLRWAGLQETFSQITDSAGGDRRIVSRDQSPIAIKVGTASLYEKFIRFQEPHYHESVRPALLELSAHFAFLKRTNPERYVAETLSSKQLFLAAETRNKSFWWKAGRYRVFLKLSGPGTFQTLEFAYRFELTTIEVDRLTENLRTIDADLRNAISSNLPDFEASPVNWNWANVDVRSV